MSRFYDALREASRSLPKSNGNTVGGTLAPDGTELRNEAIACAAAIPTVLAPDPESTEMAEASVDEFVELGTPPKNGPFASKVHTAFDPKARLVTNVPDSAVAEPYRRLRTKILQQQATKAFRSLIVVSPSPQEGKTVTVLNLGLTFAMLPSFRVLVVDGDLRRGNIGTLLGVENRPGLTNLIDGSAKLEDAVLRCADIPIHFLLRGNSEMSPAELLHSPQLGKQFRRISEQFDLVLVDSAPVNLVADSQLLAGCCDAVLLVARAF